MTQRLADFVSGTRYEDLPANVVHEAKRLLIDTIGCAIAALETESGKIAVNFAALQGGPPQATALGLEERISATAAAYVNARLANVLDIDDTFPTAAHFGNSTVFGALALAEHFDRDGKDLITAIAVGFEVGARIGSWMGPPFKVENGKVVYWNELGGPAASVVWAAVGASASISKLTPSQTNHAFGYAGACSPQPTVRKWAESPIQSMYKYADAGWCAQLGVSSALLVSLGSTAFTDILDGPNAFWKTYGSPSHDDEVLLKGLGSDWQILNTTYKPWPCCRWIHYPLTVFTRLLNKHSLKADEVEHVTVRANPFATTRIFAEQSPTEPITAEFSFPHAFAAAAYKRPPGPQWYDECFMNAPYVQAFRKKISLQGEPTASNLADFMEGGQWRGMPGGVDIKARDTVFSGTSSYAYGDPWTPETLFTDDALLEKFYGLVGSSDVSQKTVEALLGLDQKHADLKGVVELISRLGGGIIPAK